MLHYQTFWVRGVLQNVSSVYQELYLKLKPTKATGLDGIPARMLKDAVNVITKPLEYIINLTISSGEIPSEWKEAKLVSPIFKSGKRSEEVPPLIFKIMERSIKV